MSMRQKVMSVARFARTYIWSRDHHVVGLQLLGSALLCAIVGGLFALGTRWQLAWPWSDMPVVGPLLFSPESGQISPEFVELTQLLTEANTQTLLRFRTDTIAHSLSAPIPAGQVTGA